MGWTFPYSTFTKSDIIGEIIESHESETRSWRVLRHCIKGNVLWCLVESGPKDGEKRKWIACYLLGKHGGETWGYKDIDESMHPYFYSCPVSYLDEADDPINDKAREWREMVRDIAIKKANKRPRIGEIWKLHSGCNPSHVKITSVRPLRGIANGFSYRISKKYLSHRIEENGDGAKI